MRRAVEKHSSAALRSVRVAATYEKVGLTPRYSRALHLSIFEQPHKLRFFAGAIMLIASKYSGSIEGRLNQQKEKPGSVSFHLFGAYCPIV